MNIKRKKTVEQQTADAILQRAESYTLGGHRYTAPVPTLATLIEVSALVSTLPRINDKADNIMHESLRIAKDSRGLARVVATLLVGMRGSHKGMIHRWHSRRRIRKATTRLLDDTSIAELRETAILLLTRMQVGDFFGLIAFLSETNLTKATNATETTPSGQPSAPSPSGTE